MPLEQSLHPAHDRVGAGIREQRFYRLKIARCPEDTRFLAEGARIQRLQRKHAVSCGKNFGKTAQDVIRCPKVDGGSNVARIELDGTAQLGNRLVPMPKPPLDKADRYVDGNVIRKTLLSLVELGQRPGEIALPFRVVISKAE